MWSNNNFSEFFSLFNLTEDQIERLLNRNIEINELNKMKIKDLQQIIKIDEITAQIILMMWKNCCSFRNCALDGITETKNMLVSFHFIYLFIFICLFLLLFIY